MPSYSRINTVIGMDMKAQVFIKVLSLRPSFISKGGKILYNLTRLRNNLTCKAPNKNLQQTTFYFFYFYLPKKIRLDVSSESSA